MKKGLFYGFGVLALAVMALVSSVNTPDVQAASTNVNLVISGWNTLTIGVTGSFNFTELSVPTVATVQEKQFTGDDYFWVKDLKGVNSGYYTTIEVSDLVGSETAAIIPAGNVLIKVPSLANVLITGTANSLVDVPAWLTTYQDFSSAINFIKRDSWSNSGVLGQYAYFPRLELTVPAYQAADSYHGTITYTLYDLWV